MTVDTDVKCKLLKLLDEMPGNFANLPGEVFSTGTNALVPGDLYVVGLNPGRGDSYKTIRESICKWDWECYSAFLDQCWKKPCWDDQCYGPNREHCRHRPGNHHQEMVKKLLSIAAPGVDLRRIFATNAIFAKSSSAAKFLSETGWEISRAFDACRDVHDFFLSIVRPVRILCLGNGEPLSAFALLRSRLKRDEKPNYEAVKVFSTDIAISNCDPFEVRVIGVRHPSYPCFNPARDLKRYIEKNPDVMTGSKTAFKHPATHL